MASLHKLCWTLIWTQSPFEAAWCWGPCTLLVGIPTGYWNQPWKPSHSMRAKSSLWCRWRARAWHLGTCARLHTYQCIVMNQPLVKPQMSSYKVLYTIHVCVQTFWFKADGFLGSYCWELIKSTTVAGDRQIARFLPLATFVHLGLSIGGTPEISHIIIRNRHDH